MILNSQSRLFVHLIQDWLSRSVSNSRRNCQSWIWEPVLNSTCGEEGTPPPPGEGREFSSNKCTPTINWHHVVKEKNTGVVKKCSLPPCDGMWELGFEKRDQFMCESSACVSQQLAKCNKVTEGAKHQHHTSKIFAQIVPFQLMHTIHWLATCLQLASFPGPTCSLLAVRNSRRGPGLIHHVMCAAGVTTLLLDAEAGSL